MDEPYASFATGDSWAWPYAGDSTSATCSALCEAAALSRLASCLQLTKEPYDPAATRAADAQWCVLNAVDFSAACNPACSATLDPAL